MANSHEEPDNRKEETNNLVSPENQEGEAQRFTNLDIENDKSNPNEPKNVDSESPKTYCRMSSKQLCIRISILFSVILVAGIIFGLASTTINDQYTTTTVEINSEEELSIMVLGLGRGATDYEYFDNINLVNLATGEYCEPLPKFPHKLIRSTGEYSNGNLIICGGSYYDYANLGLYKGQNECYVYSHEQPEWKLLGKLIYGKDELASLVLPNKTIWITGGRNFEEYRRDSNSTAIIKTDITTTSLITIGPNLPERLSGHCMVQFNSTYIMIIEGYSSHFYDLENEIWIKGPDMTLVRHKSGCAKGKINEKKIKFLYLEATIITMTIILIGKHLKYLME